MGAALATGDLRDRRCARGASPSPGTSLSSPGPASVGTATPGGEHSLCPTEEMSEEGATDSESSSCDTRPPKSLIELSQRPPDAAPLRSRGGARFKRDTAAWLAELDRDPVAASSKESWPPHAGAEKGFDWHVPTFEAYKAKGFAAGGPARLRFPRTYATAREQLDYTYHPDMYRARLIFQDVVLSRCDLGADSAPMPGQRPWVVFTAGAMGVGKSFALLTLAKDGLFPLDAFTILDPDKLKSELPEIKGYSDFDSASAATKLHRESTMMTDVLFEHCLAARRNFLVDGSLRDVDWYMKLFARIRREQPEYQLAIFHITARKHTIINRAISRAEVSGRAVPMELLEASMEQVPRSVRALADLADVVADMANDDDAPLHLRELKAPGQPLSSWSNFRAIWGHKPPIKSKRRNKTLCQRLCPVRSRRMFSGQKHELDHYNVGRRIYRRMYPNTCLRCLVQDSAEYGHVCDCYSCRPHCVILFAKWVEENWSPLLWRMGAYDNAPSAVYAADGKSIDALETPI